MYEKLDDLNSSPFTFLLQKTPRSITGLHVRSQFHHGDRVTSRIFVRCI